MWQVSASTAHVDFVSTADAAPCWTSGTRCTPRASLRRTFLDAPEHLLVLDLLVAEADQRFQCGLIAEPVLAAHFQHLGGDEALDQAEDVGVGAALDLAQKALLVLAEEAEAVDLGQPVGQELLREVEGSAANTSVDVPADALGHLDDLGVTLGFGGGRYILHGVLLGC